MKVYLQTDGKNPIEEAIIIIEQSSKNFYKKHRRWKEHRSENYYSQVNVDVNHPNLHNNWCANIEKMYCGSYIGKASVNHRYVCNVKYLYRGRREEISSEHPYIVMATGNISCGEIAENFELTNLFSNK